jgi:hypothetical protein
VSGTVNGYGKIVRKDSQVLCRVPPFLKVQREENMSTYGTTADAGEFQQLHAGKQHLHWLVGVVCLGGCQFGYNTCVVNPIKLMLSSDFPSMSDGLWYLYFEIAWSPSQ